MKSHWIGLDKAIKDRFKWCIAQTETRFEIGYTVTDFWGHIWKTGMENNLFWSENKVRVFHWVKVNTYHTCKIIRFPHSKFWGVLPSPFDPHKRMSPLVHNIWSNNIYHQTKWEVYHFNWPWLPPTSDKTKALLFYPETVQHWLPCQTAHHPQHCWCSVNKQ